VIDVDLTAMLYCTLAVLPVMRIHGDGRIVHIASQAGVSLTPITGRAIWLPSTLSSR
jgi:short-subunit dehydrogenase